MVCRGMGFPGGILRLERGDRVRSEVEVARYSSDSDGKNSPICFPRAHGLGKAFPPNSSAVSRRVAAWVAVTGCHPARLAWGVSTRIASTRRCQITGRCRWWMFLSSVVLLLPAEGRTGDRLHLKILLRVL